MQYRANSAHPGAISAQRRAVPQTVKPKTARVVRSWLFEPTLASDTISARDRSTSLLAAELARQLLVLLEDGKIQPGDLFYDTSGAVLRLVGESATPVGKSSLTGVTNSVILSVAHRYGLLRHRPVRPDDPPPPQHPSVRTRSWEISPAARVLAPVVAAELALDLARD